MKKCSAYKIQPATQNDIKKIAHLISIYLGTMDFVSSEKEESLEQIQYYNEKAVSKIINDTIIAKTQDGQIIGACGLEENKKGDYGTCKGIKIHKNAFTRKYVNYLSGADRNFEKFLLGS